MTKGYITAIALDETGIARRDEQLESERHVAMNDLIEWNHFALKECEGPYRLTLGSAEGRITFTLAADGAEKPVQLALPLAPLRSIFKDYQLICESYFEAVRLGNLPRIEAIDMSRRGLHNEGADLLAGQLEGRAEMDSETARRLFTLLYVLHLK